VVSGTSSAVHIFAVKSIHILHSYICMADSNSGLDALATLAASSLELESLELGEKLNFVTSN